MRLVSFHVAWLALMLGGSGLSAVRDGVELADPSPRAIAFIRFCLNL